VQNAHAGFAVGNERFPVAIADLGCKQIEIATKIEYTGRP